VSLDIVGGDIGDDFAFAPLPGEHISLVGGAQLGLNANTRHAAEAVAFALFWTEKSNQLALAQQLWYGPVIREFYETPQPDVPHHQNLRQLASNIRYRPQSPLYQSFTAVIMDAVHALAKGDLSPAQAAAQIKKRSAELTLPQAVIEFPDLTVNVTYY
jgi:ABC-type glycerol-3-phosphate transport system substrate-binding protein